MNAHTSPDTETARAILTIASVDGNDRVVTAWRYSAREVADHILFIRAHIKTIAERDEMLTATIRVHSPKYVAYARKQLACRLRLYAEAVRRVSECELKMAEAGIPFSRSSDAWEN